MLRRLRKRAEQPNTDETQQVVFDRCKKANKLYLNSKHVRVVKATRTTMDDDGGGRRRRTIIMLIMIIIN